MFVLFLLAGASIHGTVYDLSLSVKENSIVRINTAPEQQFVAKDGSYTFNVPIGIYNISAFFEGEYVSEIVEVVDNDDYVIDLILSPEFEMVSNPVTLWPVFLATALVLSAIGGFSIKRRKYVVEDLQPIIEFIQHNDGRTTQAEIVNNFPMSEAKISLMLSELEHSGRIRKIKKGRANIILLS